MYELFTLANCLSNNWVIKLKVLVLDMSLKCAGKAVCCMQAVKEILVQ